VFTSLAYWGHYFLSDHFDMSGGVELMTAQCPPNPGPYNVRYLGVGPVDAFLCFLVTFFQTNIDSDTVPFSIDFVSSFAALVALTFIEPIRSGYSTALGFPVISVLFYHLKGGGVGLPLFWLVLILSGHNCLKPVAARIDQAKAEATLFAVLAGFALPTALMFILQDPIVTAAFQFFPVWMWVAKAGHLFFRPSSRYNTSGYWTVQATFIVTFVMSAISHIAALWVTSDDPVFLKHLYVPPISTPDPATITIQLATHVFLQWDAVFTMGSSLLGMLWFAENAKEAAWILLWNVIATVIVGPGAAVSSVLIWREWRLNGAPEEAPRKT
jgi:hypothetical protein